MTFIDTEQRRIIMKQLWQLSHYHKKQFLFINTVLFAGMGFLVWTVVRLFALKENMWAFCFMGYAGYFIGFLGGILYLYQTKERY